MPPGVLDMSSYPRDSPADARYLCCRTHKGAGGNPAIWQRCGKPQKNTSLKSHILIMIHPQMNVTYGGTQKKRWSIKENPFKMDDLGAPPFWETSIS